MRKLFGLFPFALTLLAPSAASAVNCFWVGGTGTWDTSSTANWAATSGGAATGCQTTGTAPANGDTIVFDGSSGGGTVTAAAGISGMSFVSITAGAFTGTLDFSVNNPSLTITTQLSFSGSGLNRKFLMGTGTFTLTANSGTVYDLGTTTNLDGTSNFSTASYVISSTTTFDRTFNGGARSYGPTTISSNTSRGNITILGANTFSTLSVAAGTNLELANAATQTITTAPTWTGTSSNPIYIRSNSANNVATIAIGSGTLTCDWCGLYRITTSGGTARNATNSLDFGRNTGTTITAPSGGAASPRTIGG